MDKKLCYDCKVLPRAAHMSYCRSCQNERQKKWRERNKISIEKQPKTCARCKTNVRISSHSYCTDCRKVEWDKWSKEHPGYNTRKERLWNRDMNYWYKNKVARLRSIAKQKNLEFNLSIADLEAEYTEYCPILNLKLNYLNSVGRGRQNDSASIDRIDPTKGYIKGNIWIISNRANTYKSNLSLEIIGILYEKVSERLNGATSNTSSETTNNQ